MVVEFISEILLSLGIEIHIKRVQYATQDDIKTSDVCVFASPTYEHGKLQEDFEPFVEKMKNVDLKGKPCAVIGLGDSKYEREYHLESARILEAFVESIHGTLVHRSLRITKTPVNFFDRIQKWAESFAATIKNI
jgi:flavodoxin